ncbi:carbonic anhydrase [Paroceanicella profunda]|uniref:Carbonic anhydrase n=1 Tax=Paroceanicella profunda TaxID=2579971 RepID=A0A5B8FIC7_9RHOB|nr:carbonic anhydrase [Paroceanicella profunda]QDL93097.1 carbonic anhydrase [Paroceanicella profunda]
MDRLVEGYRRFRAGVWPGQRARYESLSEVGQSPEALVIACSDSRVDPSVVFDAGPGEMFVVRNVAGLVPPYEPDGRRHGTSAALEYAVRVLKVDRIVVLGHAQCGGVQALVQGMPAEVSDFLETWMSTAGDALSRTPPEGVDPLEFYETEVVRVSLTNLMTFPWVREAVEAGRLQLAGFRFGIATGKLLRLSEGGFVDVQ